MAAMSPIRMAMQAARLTVPEREKPVTRDIYPLAAAHLGVLVPAYALERDRVAVLLDAAQDAGWGRQEAAAAVVRLFPLGEAYLGRDGIDATIRHMAVRDAYDRGDLPGLEMNLGGGPERMKNDYAALAHVVRTVLDAVELSGTWAEGG